MSLRQSKPTDRPRTVLFLGTHGQQNVGDELLLHTFLTQLGPEHRYLVNSYDPEATATWLSDWPQVEVFDTAGNRLRFARHLLQCDIVIFGGGSIVKELYPSTGRWRHATLLMVLATVAFARLVARRPVIMSNIGVGPITTPMGRFLARRILKLASHVTVRDQGSADICDELGLTSQKVQRVPDAVWINKVTDLIRVGASTVAPQGPSGTAASEVTPIRLALNLNHDIANGANWETFTAQLTEAIRIVAHHRPLELHALPMQCGFKDNDDLAMITQLFRRLETVSSIVHQPKDHWEVASIISNCDVVVSERLHAIVLAAIVGRPVVALPYDVKVSQLTGQLGLDRRSFDVNRPFDPEALAGAILAAADDSAESERLTGIAELNRQHLEQHFDQLREWVRQPCVPSGP